MFHHRFLLILAAFAAGAAALWFGVDPAGASALPLYAGAVALAAPGGAVRFANEPAGAHDQGSWRVLPMEGAFEISYTDALGNWSVRRLIGRELKVGPGRVLLGGLDMASGGYRGFRADRIMRLVDATTGAVIDRNIVDWLIKRATPSKRTRRAAD